MNVAQKILAQLGNQALYMMGAKNFVASQYGVHFRIGKNSTGINCIQIDLRSDDLYDLTFWKIRGADFKQVEKLEGYYNDMLHAGIKRTVKMRLSLSRVYA